MPESTVDIKLLEYQEESGLDVSWDPVENLEVSGVPGLECCKPEDSMQVFKMSGSSFGSVCWF